jgi:ABC-type antimicrobial peptide transport system permease subunit
MELIITIVCGSLLGTSISIYLAEPLMTNSNFRISIDTLVLVKSFLIMTLGAMLSSLIPMYLISKTDPSSALKGA